MNPSFKINASRLFASIDGDARYEINVIYHEFLLPKWSRQPRDEVMTLVGQVNLVVFMCQED